MIIKNCFLNNNFTENERYIISVSTTNIEKETEKAILVNFKSDFGSLTSWIPKSVILTEPEEVKEKKKEEPKNEKVDLMMKNKAGELIHIIEKCGRILKSEDGKAYDERYLILA